MSMEYKVLIGGTEYGMGDIQSVGIKQPLFDRLSVGNACAAELDITFWPIGTVPRMATIVPYARKSASTPWVKLGVFWLYSRDAEEDTLHVIAYDAMVKGDVVWNPAQSLVFPMTMRDAVDEIARIIGLEIDSRTVVSDTYTIDYPANDYTLRDVLGFIAAANAGNWIITAAGKLLLVPLFSSMPEETNYLVTEDGDAITFGGTVILV